jgi:hypothetical protein
MDGAKIIEMLAPNGAMFVLFYWLLSRVMDRMDRREDRTIAALEKLTESYATLAERIRTMPEQLRGVGEAMVKISECLAVVRENQKGVAK